MYYLCFLYLYDYIITQINIKINSTVEKNCIKIITIIIYRIRGEMRNVRKKRNAAFIQGYNPYNNILICMDIDGTVLTDFVEHQGSLDTTQVGDYELTFFIYSRVTASSAFRTMKIHVISQ